MMDLTMSQHLLDQMVDTKGRLAIANFLEVLDSIWHLRLDLDQEINSLVDLLLHLIEKIMWTQPHLMHFRPARLLASRHSKPLDILRLQAYLRVQHQHHLPIPLNLIIMLAVQ